MERADTQHVKAAFAQVLREKRKALGISQEEFAGRAGIAMRYVSLLECQKRQPTIGMMYQLATALDISMSEFVTEIENRMDKGTS